MFCAEKSVEKLKKKGFKRAYEHWNIKHKMPYMWFTCRFYTALDIELEEQPDIVFVTEPYFTENTIIDPCTDAVQAIGRFCYSSCQYQRKLSGTHQSRHQGISQRLQGCLQNY